MDNSNSGLSHLYDAARNNHGGAEMPLGTFGPLAPLPTSGYEAFECEGFNQPRSRSITFNDGVRKATLDLSGNEIKYSGDLPVGESARRFCDAVFGELQPKTCGTCHWYNIVQGFDSLKCCHCPKVGCKLDYDDTLDCACTAPGEYGSPGVLPGPNFGCIHHKVESQ